MTKKLESSFIPTNNSLFSSAMQVFSRHSCEGRNPPPVIPSFSGCLSASGGTRESRPSNNSASSLPFVLLLPKVQKAFRTAKLAIVRIHHTFRFHPAQTVAVLKTLFYLCWWIVPVATSSKILIITITLNLWNEWSRASSPQAPFHISEIFSERCFLWEIMLQNMTQRFLSLICMHWPR